MVTKSFGFLKVQKIAFSENLKKKFLAQAILITIGGYILECTNNIAIQELEFFLSQFLRKSNVNSTSMGFYRGNIDEVRYFRTFFSVFSCDRPIPHPGMLAALLCYILRGR